MNLNPVSIGFREKQILAGLYLSKFDAAGLVALGFESFTEAFNALGYAMGVRPASIKNYRDEFDPLFPNPRSGWWKRERRAYCLKVEEEYRHLPLEGFTALIASFVGEVSGDTPSPKTEFQELTPNSFAKRLITGRAAEQYFQKMHCDISEFQGYEIEDTTAHGCGYDFRLWPKNGNVFQAVEVKGMQDESGYLSLTEKEHACAVSLGERYFLFVVKNFREKPFHQIYMNPLAGNLVFERKERTAIQVSWTAAA